MVPRDGVSRSRAEGETATQGAVAPPIEGPVTSETSLDGAAPPLSSSSGTMTTCKPRAPAVREPKGVPGTPGKPGGAGGGGGGGVAPAPPPTTGAKGGAGGPL